MTSSGTLLVGTYRDGVHRSTDLGRTWTLVGFERNVYVDDILEDHLGRIFTAVAYSVGDEPVGIFRSDDDGQNWVQAGLQSENVFSVSTPLPGHLFAGTERGTYQSKDDGETWSLVEELSFPAPLSIVVALGDILFAGFAEPRYRAPGQVVLRSSDGGKSWIPMAGLPAETSVRSLVLSGDTLFAAAGDIFRRGGTGLYRSSDLRSWEQIGFEDVGLRDLIAKKSGKLLVSSEKGVFVSSAKRRTWRKKNSGLRVWQADALEVDETGRLYAMELSTLSIYNKIKKNWTSHGLPEGISPPTPMNLLRLQDSTIVLPGNGGIFLSNSPLESWLWRPIPKMDGPVHAFYEAPDRRLFTTLRSLENRNHYTTFLTKDAGKTWETVAVPEGTQGVIVSPAGTLLAYGGDGLHRSMGEEMWKKVSRDGSRIMTIEVCGEALYTGTLEDGILTSNDDGRTWKPITEKLRQEANQQGYLAVSKIFCFPDEGILASTFSNGIFYRPPNGSWENINKELPTKMLGDIARGPDGIIYLSTIRGIFYSKAWSKDTE